MDPITEQWEEGFNALCRFVERNGHALVPANYVDDGFLLGGWVGTRRSEAKLGKLTSERKARLEALPGWSWEPHADLFTRGLAHLQQFVAEFGDSNVPAKFTSSDGFKLGIWVSNRRSDFQRGRLEEEEVGSFEAVPMWTWTPLADAYLKRLKQLRTYVSENGDARVPDDYVCDDGERLGAWVGTQRSRFRQGKLTTDQISALESLPGWIWDPVSDIFPNGFRHLEAYVREFGDALVPGKYSSSDGYPLGNWVMHQRGFFKSGTLSAERIEILNEVSGWSWDPVADRFIYGLRHMEEYVSEHGNARVPQNFETKDDFKLGAWVQHQRGNRNRGRMSADQVATFEALPGWVWDTDAFAFANGIEHLKQYISESGNCRPAALYVCSDGFRLGSWVHNARNKRERLPTERAKRGRESSRLEVVCQGIALNLWSKRVLRLRTRTRKAVAAHCTGDRERLPIFDVPRGGSPRDDLMSPSCPHDMGHKAPQG